MPDRIPLPDSEELERRREKRFLQRIAIGGAILLGVLLVVLLFLMWITDAFA